MKIKKDKWNFRLLKSSLGWRILIINKVMLRTWISDVAFSSERLAKRAVNGMIRDLERWHNN